MAPKPEFKIGVDARDLTNLYRDLDAAGKEIAAGLLADVKAAAQPVLDDAISTASQSSTRIPASMRLVSRGGRGHVAVAIRAGNKDAPHAAAFENGGKPGKFRHMVFGNRSVWVQQDAHPALLPALQRNLQRVADAVTDAVDKHLRAHRL